VTELLCEERVLSVCCRRKGLSKKILSWKGGPRRGVEPVCGDCTFKYILFDSGFIILLKHGSAYYTLHDILKV